MQAATIYHTRPGFESALVSPTTITFEGLASPGGQVYYGSAGLNISGVTIRATNNNLYALSSTDPFTVAMNASLFPATTWRGLTTRTATRNPVPITAG
jgi:hypothetical protein